MKQDIFAVKLCELARQFERMQRRLRLCQTEDHPRIRQEMTRLLKEYRETDQLLSRPGRRQPAPLPPPRFPRRSRRTAAKRKKFWSRPLRTLNPAARRPAEAMALYAEYAMDFAAQACGTPCWRR